MTVLEDVHLYGTFETLLMSNVWCLMSDVSRWRGRKKNDNNKNNFTSSSTSIYVIYLFSFSFFFPLFPLYFTSKQETLEIISIIIEERNHWNLLCLSYNVKGFSMRHHQRCVIKFYRSGNTSRCVVTRNYCSRLSPFCLSTF